MEREIALKILSDLRSDLREKYGVKSIAVFGSTARGEARPDSDVDVLVDFEKPSGLFKFVNLGSYLEDKLGQEVDLATPGALRSPVRERVYEDLIYAT